EVRLDREVASVPGEVGRVDSHEPEERVRRVAEELQIAALVDMSVVVDPRGGHLRMEETRRRVERVADGVPLEEGSLPGGERRAGADARPAQALEHADEAFVAQPLQVADGRAVSLEV